MASDVWAEADGEQPLSRAIYCTNCGEWHSQCRANAAAILRESIARDSRDRLTWTEGALRLMHEGDRVAVARWIQGVLDRPPLANTRTRTLEPIRAVLDALWRDIYEITPDPLSPVFDYQGESWKVWTPHHELAEMREGELV